MSGDEDQFKKRLDDVNQELADTLKRNEEQRYQLMQTSKNLGQPGDVFHNHTYGATYGSGVGRYSSRGPTTTTVAGAQIPFDTFTNPAIMTNSDQVAREISVAVAREMKMYEVKVQEMVEREWEMRLQGLDQTLRSRFTEMQTMHERMTQVLLDTSKGLEKHKKQSQQQQEKLEQLVDDSLDDFRKDLRSNLQEVHREVRNLRDQVNEGQIDGRADAKEINRRIDDTQRRVAGIQHEVELGVDGKLVTIRQEVLDRTKVDMRRQEDDLEKLRRDLVAAQGTMDQAVTKVGKLAEEVDMTSDTAITQGSQIRTMTGDLQQLDLLIKRRQDKPSLGPTGGDSSSSATTQRVQQDVFSLKQSVAYLASVLEANGLLKGGGGKHRSGGGGVSEAFNEGSEESDEE